jgi:iron complex transport system substrate-binding protein
VTYGGLTQLLADLGAEPVPLVQDMADRGVIWAETVSIEAFPELDADFVFSTYPIDEGPQAEFEAIDALLPGWCDLIRTCAEGRYILIPRDYSGSTFREFEIGTQFIVSHVAGRPGVEAPE